MTVEHAAQRSEDDVADELAAMTAEQLLAVVNLALARRADRSDRP